MATKVTTVRLEKADLANIKAIVASGSASTVSGAVRVALYEAAERRRISAQGQEKTA